MVKYVSILDIGRNAIGGSTDFRLPHWSGKKIARPIAARKVMQSSLAIAKSCCHYLFEAFDQPAHLVFYDPSKSSPYPRHHRDVSWCSNTRRGGDVLTELISLGGRCSDGAFE